MYAILDRLQKPELGSKAWNVFKILDTKENGLRLPLRGQYPLILDVKKLRFIKNDVSWGALGDSFVSILHIYYVYRIILPSIFE